MSTLVAALSIPADTQAADLAISFLVGAGRRRQR